MFQTCISKGICGGAVKISTDNRIVSIVDDELDITELFREAICDSIDGISVVTFNDPVIALEHFTNNKKDYALVISDFRMPGINGLELLKRIKSSSPNVRAIIMSAFDIEFDELCRAYSDAGIVDS
ncbi:MAG TPA: response regulator, partial [Nitrososphaeraceae archaeon]|nr:response regulator [Nitrososphaeraceae archaeon]